MKVYILFQRYQGRDQMILGVYATRKAAYAEKKRIREAERNTDITFPIEEFDVEGSVQ